MIVYELRQTKQNDDSNSSATLDNCERLHGVAPSAIREIHLKTSAFYKMQTNNKIKVYVNNLLAGIRCIWTYDSYKFFIRTSSKLVHM